MIPALTSVFGRATTYHHPIPTGAHISNDLVCRGRCNNTPWRKNRTRRNAISDSNRFGQHGQACFREENPLCEVRAPNKILHTKQDTTHFLLLDGETIHIDGEILTWCWQPTDHKRCQLENLKHRAS